MKLCVLPSLCPSASALPSSISGRHHLWRLLCQVVSPACTACDTLTPLTSLMGPHTSGKGLGYSLALAPSPLSTALCHSFPRPSPPSPWSGQGSQANNTGAWPGLLLPSAHPLPVTGRAWPGECASPYESQRSNSGHQAGLAGLAGLVANA